MKIELATVTYSVLPILPTEPMTIAILPTQPMSLPTEPMILPTEPMSLPTEPMILPTEPMTLPTEPMIPPKEPMTLRHDDLDNQKLYFVKRLFLLSHIYLKAYFHPLYRSIVYLVAELNATIYQCEFPLYNNLLDFRHAPR